VTTTSRSVGARSYTMELVRERWRGRAALAWVPAELYFDLAARVDEVLGSRERDMFGRFEYERRRTAYLLGRFAAKLALGHLANGIPHAAIDVMPGCFQQPVVLAPVDTPLGVSISHAATAACAIAFPDEHPMGVDVEEIDAARARVMKTQLVPRELAAIAPLGDEVTLAAAVWTAKEALSKVIRSGMTVPFELFEVDAPRRDGADVFGVFRNFGQYRFHTRILAGSVVSIVLPRKTELVVDPDFLRN